MLYCVVTDEMNVRVMRQKVCFALIQITFPPLKCKDKKHLSVFSKVRVNEALFYSTKQVMSNSLKAHKILVIHV